MTDKAMPDLGKDADTTSSWQSDVAQFNRVQIWLLLILLVVAAIAVALGGIYDLTGFFLREQDVWGVGAFVIGGFVINRHRERLARLWSAFCGDGFGRVWWLAAAVFVAAFIGTYLVFLNYPLSLDEFWAKADGAIFARGVPLAQLPEEWRIYGDALQPIFTRLVPDEGYWVSAYLPLNAVLQWLGGPFASPAMAAGSVVMIALIARQLLPDQPFAPFIAALLLATSSQFLLTAMTPYSMTAHLLSDLVWLWLFIQRKAWAYIASLAVAACAMGLHQEVFFPLFALPFLLERFLSGSRVFSVLYVVCLGIGFLAWNAYDLFVYSWFDIALPTQSASGSSGKLTDLLERLAQIELSALATMAANLLRFVVWQNPAVAALCAMAAWPVAGLANQAPRELRAALLSILGASVFLLLVIAYQGHGWGYRYLHGQMGGAVLIATYAFGQLSQGANQSAWRGALLGMSALALVLIPLRAWQAHNFTAPYAYADAAMLAWEGVDVIVIDAPSHAFTIDLVRNDVWLRNPIKRMAANRLSSQQLADLCGRYRVSFFTDADAWQYGIRGLPQAMQRERAFPNGCSG